MLSSIANRKSKNDRNVRPKSKRGGQLSFVYTASLQGSFRMFSGMGPGREQALFAAGILTWLDLTSALAAKSLPFKCGADRYDSLLRELSLAHEAFEANNAKFFAERLPRSEWFRLLDAFPNKVAYLDIETTGLSHYYDQITLIGAALGQSYACYVSHPDKARLGDVADMLNDADVVVTYNGTLFDLPFISRQIPELGVPNVHFDLRYACKRLGLTGGQKAIELELGISRMASVSELNGEKAPLLWHNYKLGSLDDLKDLIRYNASDIEGLRKIAAVVLARMSGGVPPKRSENLPEPTFVGDVENASGVFIRPFPKSKNKQLRYADLIDRADLKPIRIVGIDLTGSEARPSGWALLQGSDASTQLVSTDEELIAQTINYRPDLISIDSPLSMPEGRTKVTDDDPARQEFGIMRSCERILKARGVNVYPSLLPSMQRLTARGIKLAAAFRRMGIPVLESYPGAAQDIMGIPRKQAGLEYLAQGLRDFGLRSDEELVSRSHDELDALTSAAVGLFFWGDRFEAIGNEAEDFLIIPRLEAVEKASPRLVVGLSGRISAGKSTAASILGDIGFTGTRFSSVLQDILAAEGIAPTREALQELGQRVNRSPGQRWLCRQAVLRHPEARVLVIDGMRFPMDHATLAEMFGADFVHLHITASIDVRRSRYVSSGRSADEFDIATKHPVESQIWSLRHLADYLVSNDGDLQLFRASLRRAIMHALDQKVKGKRCQSRSSLVDSLARKAKAKSRTTL